MMTVESNDWMVVYRQGRQRFVKVAMEYLTWAEAHEVAGKIVEVNQYIDNKADHFQAWCVVDLINDGPQSGA